VYYVIALVALWCFGLGVLILTTGTGRLLSSDDMDQLGFVGWIVAPLMGALVPFFMVLLIATLEIHSLWHKR